MNNISLINVSISRYIHSFIHSFIFFSVPEKNVKHKMYVKIRV